MHSYRCNKTVSLMTEHGNITCFLLRSGLKTLFRISFATLLPDYEKTLYNILLSHTVYVNIFFKHVLPFCAISRKFVKITCFAMHICYSNAALTSTLYDLQYIRRNLNGFVPFFFDFFKIFFIFTSDPAAFS